MPEDGDRYVENLDYEYCAILEKWIYAPEEGTDADHRKIQEIGD